MNTLDKKYTDLLQDILDNGVTKQDRTGTGTISVFGRQIRHKMSEGFPLLTTKKMYFKGVVTELLWFLRGDTNIKYLVDNDCHIWGGDAYKNYERRWETEGKFLSPPVNKFTKEEFINEIKTNPMVAKELGELGPIYGKQWRRWSTKPNQYGEYESNPIDQIQNLINDLKNNPDSRRLMVNAWNVAELDSMTLPPCHYGFQVYTRELSLEERHKLALPIWKEKYGSLADMMVPTNVDNTPYKIPRRAISLMWNQRSVDTFLGLPFNIASYGLLLEIIAKEVNMVPDELIGNLGDTHLYSNHIEQAKEQIGRKFTEEEIQEHLMQSGMDALMIDARARYIDNLPKKTREPYPLPKLGKIPDYLCRKDNWECYKPSDFTLENYQSHPSIKAPLSN